MGVNKRIHYAIQQVGFKALDHNSYTVAHGVQSFGTTTTFDVEQVFEYGQLEIYANIEGIPNVEVTLNKVLDGHPLLYHLATKGTATTTPTLTGRANTNTFFAAAIFSDDRESAGGVAPSIVECSGMYVSSVGYNFPSDGNFSEDLTLTGNDRVWKNDSGITNSITDERSNSLSFDGAFSTTDEPASPNIQIARREHLLFGAGNGGTDSNSSLNDPDITVLPQDIYGITASGTNELTSNIYGAHVSNISVSADFGRDGIPEIGRKGFYHRTVNFPVEVTCEIEVTSVSGDMVSATEEGILTVGTGACTQTGNLTSRTIRIASCDGTRIYLGRKNKLSSVNYTGGDTGGGNVAVSYTYTTMNDFTVVHSGDPHASGTNWWTERGGEGDRIYLTENEVSTA